MFYLQKKYKFFKKNLLNVVSPENYLDQVLSDDTEEGNLFKNFFCLEKKE